MSWIGEQCYIKMLVQKKSNNPDICGYLGKLSEQHFIKLLSSNPVYNILILVEIYEARFSEYTKFTEKKTQKKNKKTYCISEVPPPMVNARFEK